MTELSVGAAMVNEENARNSGPLENYVAQSSNGSEEPLQEAYIDSFLSSQQSYLYWWEGWSEIDKS